MRKYEAPVVMANEEMSEGVYAASGTVENAIGCDSIYMQGTYQAPDYSDWAGVTRGYKQQFGCLGCPAFTADACGLTTHYVESGNASSYDVDNGKRKPSWEAKGYGPNDPVTDWNM